MRQEPVMNECVFCAMVAGNVPASVVYEDDRVMAFMDINPVNQGHVLVVPKAHMPLLTDMDEETGAHLFKIAMRLAQALRQLGIRCEGMNLFLADGEAAFQGVFHVHLHVLPRFQGDSFKIDADWSVQPSRRELDEVAALLKRTYTSLWQGK